MATKKSPKKPVAKMQVHNRYQGRKKFEAARAKMYGTKVKRGFKKLKPFKKDNPSKKPGNGLAQRIVKMAAKVRRECSHLSSSERERLLQSALKRAKR